LRFIDSRPVVRVRVDRYDWVPAEGRKMTFRMDFSAEAGAEFIGGVADNQDTSIEGEFGLYQGDERSAYTYVSLNIPASQDTLVWIFTGTVVDSLGQEGFASVEFPQYGAGCDNTPARCGQTNACGVYGGDCPCDNTPPSCGQTNACGVYGGDCPPANLQNISFSPSSITTISVGQSTTFSVSGNNIAHYEWDLDGSRVGSSSSYTYTPGAGDSGPHTVVGRVYNSSRSSTDDNTWNFGVITGGAP